MKSKIVPGLFLSPAYPADFPHDRRISGAENSDHKWGKIGFQVPVAFSTPQKVGLDAAAMVYPPESGLGKGQMEITLVAVPKDMQESLGNKDAEILTYVKTTFLGATLPAAKSVQRSFLGKRLPGKPNPPAYPRSRIGNLPDTLNRRR